jgi:hypothetical protein
LKQRSIPTIIRFPQQYIRIIPTSTPVFFRQIFLPVFQNCWHSNVFKSDWLRCGKGFTLWSLSSATVESSETESLLLRHLREADSILKCATRVSGVTAWWTLCDKELSTRMNKSRGMRVGLFRKQEMYRILDENSQGMRLFGTRKTRQLYSQQQIPSPQQPVHMKMAS